MLEALAEFIMYIVILILEAAFWIGCGLYDLIFSNKIDKVNLTEIQKILLHFCGIFVMSILVLAIIFLILYFI